MAIKTFRLTIKGMIVALVSLFLSLIQTASAIIGLFGNEIQVDVIISLSNQKQKQFESPAALFNGEVGWINEPEALKGNPTTYQIPYTKALEWPVCEVNINANWADRIPLLGHFLELKSKSTGLSSFCMVIGTFDDKINTDRYLILSKMAANQLDFSLAEGITQMTIRTMSEQEWQNITEYKQVFDALVTR